MTDARSAYDESNEVWPFFLITLLGVVLVPMTVGQLSRLFFAAKPNSNLSPEHRSFQLKRTRKHFLSSWKLWFVVAGWAFVAFLLKVVQDSGAGAAADAASADRWDPYEILHVATSATTKEIKSAYRKLSLQFHPDKVKDVTDATREQIENVYVEITKAYRALTDEVTRENYLLYGHPDGPQPVAHGVALPAFLFNTTASALFISLYLLGFGVGVPLIVALVWSRSQQRTRHGLLQASASQFAELLAKEQPHFLTRQRVLKEVLSSADMTEALAPETYTLEERHALLNSYLSRKSPQTYAELTVAVESARLLMALHDVAANFRSFGLCQRAIEIRRTIIQAVPFERTGDAETIQLRGSPALDQPSGAQAESSGLALLKSVEDARRYLPHLHLYDAEFRVLGAKKVYTNSRAHLEIKFAVVPLGDTPPRLSADELEKLELDDAGSPDKHNASRPPLGPAVAPYFPVEAPVTWQIYLYNDRDNKLVEKPLELTNMELHNLKLTRAQVADNEDVHADTILVPMSTPTSIQPGIAPLRMAVLNTTYFGCDMVAPVVMNVVAAPPPEPQNDDDISDPENDSEEEEEEGLSDIDTSTEEEDEGEDTAAAEAATKAQAAANQKADAKANGKASAKTTGDAAAKKAAPDNAGSNEK